MNNILYIDDYINLYNKNRKEIIKCLPYKDTLKNGLIIDRKKFIKRFNKLLNDYKLKNKIFSDNVLVIINNLYNKDYKLYLKDILEELNYKNIKYISEIKYLNFNKKTIFINCNYTYFYITYINEFGNIEINLYKNDFINKEILLDILKLINKKTIILYGKNSQEIKNYLNKKNIDYFIYEDTDNLLINLVKIKNM